MVQGQDWRGEGKGDITDVKVKENSFTCLQLVVYYSEEHALCFLFVPEKIKMYLSYVTNLLKESNKIKWNL